MECKIKSEKGFYVGDTCFVLSNKMYDAISSAEEFVNPNTGSRIVRAWTATGDGTYTDNALRSYSVDACHVGIVPLELLRENAYTDAGQVFKGAGAATFYAENGVFEITLPSGEHVRIDTRSWW